MDEEEEESIKGLLSQYFYEQKHEPQEKQKGLEAENASVTGMTK